MIPNTVIEWLLRVFLFLYKALIQMLVDLVAGYFVYYDYLFALINELNILILRLYKADRKKIAKG